MFTVVVYERNDLGYVLHDVWNNIEITWIVLKIHTIKIVSWLHSVLRATQSKIDTL